MNLTADFHTHTPYSHGKNSVEENVAKAKELGLKGIAITDHGFSHVVYGLRRKEVESYKAECKAAAEKYAIDVYVGLEANIRSVSGDADITEKDYENFDIYLCGHHVYVRYLTWLQLNQVGFGNWISQTFLHRTTDKQVKRNTEMYINTIKKNPIDAITHLSYVCPANTLEVAKCAADYGTYIELNAKKSHLTDEQLSDIVQKTSARFIINSDAHSADRVGDTKLVEEQLERIGFPMDRIDNIDGRFPNFRFTEFKKKL